MMISIYFLICSIDLIIGARLNKEQQLINYLYENSSRYARPVLNVSWPINATFGIELNRLVKVNEREQTMTTEVWMRQYWNTDIFKWDPKDCADGRASGGPMKYNLLVNVYPDGHCTWLAPATFTSTCIINIKDFPFDEQICKLAFVSWVLTDKQMNVTLDNRQLITKEFINSTEWDIVEASKKIEEKLYRCCSDSFRLITFEFKLRRKYYYYVFNVIIPGFLLVIPILIGFFLHPESGERIALTITIVLSILVFLQITGQSLPQNSDSIPLLAAIYIFIMSTGVISLIETCVVLALQYQGNSPNQYQMPKLMKKLFFGFLAKVMFVDVKGISDSPSGRAEKDKIGEKESDICFCVSMTANGTMKKRDNKEELFTITSSKDDDTSILILKELRYMNQLKKDKFDQESLSDEWKMLGKVIDRLFFWIFFITISLFTGIIIRSAYKKHL